MTLILLISKEVIKNLPELRINLAGEDFTINQIPCKTVSDFNLTGGSPSTSGIMKRYGIQFGDLKPNQIDQLDYFIRNHTVSA